MSTRRRARQSALERAALIARKCGAALPVVDVLSAPADARRALRDNLEDELMARRRQQLARIVYRIRGVPVDTGVLAGRAVEAHSPYDQGTADHVGLRGSSASAELQSMSRRRTLAGSDVGAATVLNLSFLQSLRGSLALSGLVQNVLDRRYTDPGSEEHRQDRIDQNGRTLFVGLRKKWSK